MSKFNKDELNPPSWINETFFEEVLRASENDNTIKVNKLKKTPAAEKGDHYASIMFRTKITYNSEASTAKGTSLILKTMPETNCHKNEMFGELPMFEMEIDMYSRIIPKFEDELRKIGDNTVLGGIVCHSLEPRKCIIFKDLVESGYTSVRGRFLNITEAKAAFLKLTKWHAVSYKLAVQKRDVQESWKWKAGRCYVARFSELLLLISYLPIVYVVVDGSVEIEEVMQSEKAFRKTYNNPAYIRELKLKLPKLYHKGYFE